MSLDSGTAAFDQVAVPLVPPPDVSFSLSRRAFAGGLAGFALGGLIGGPARAQSQPLPASLDPALSAIRRYAAAHQTFFHLPALTMGIAAPGGLATTIDMGLANLELRRPLTSDRLFQVGSISKMMVALVVHQLAAEGKFALTDPVDRLLPTLPLPRASAITVQHLLDHRSGLPADAPLFPPGGLWTGFMPGSRWSYSNTGYEILGKLAEQAGGKPLAHLLDDRLFKPLGMGHSLGAIAWRDRAAFAQGYEPLDASKPYSRGAALAPAAWVDVTFGAGSVASSASDMNLFLAALAAAQRGGTMPGLDAPQTAAYLTHTASAAPRDMRYGNGFMHVASGPRQYLHHTGGMTSFSSALHLDKASGVGAFASASLSGYASYRPALLTQFAVDAVTAALAGRPLPTPRPLDDRIANAAAFVGRYQGQSGTFEVLAGNPLTISANGRSATLQSWGDKLFHTTHPDFDRYSLQFEAAGGRMVRANWGPATFNRIGVPPLPRAPSNPDVARLAGRYVSDSPWFGVNEVVERGGRLFIGTEIPLTAIGNDLWRAGDDRFSPERVRFGDPIDGRPQTFYFSGEKFVRHDI